MRIKLNNEGVNRNVLLESLTDSISPVTVKVFPSDIRIRVHSLWRCADEKGMRQTLQTTYPTTRTPGAWTLCWRLSQACDDTGAAHGEFNFVSIRTPAISGPVLQTAVALAFEEMRTPYASGREICGKIFGNAYQRKEIEKRMPHFESTFTTEFIKRFSKIQFSSQTIRVFLSKTRVCTVIVCAMFCLRRFETESCCIRCMRLFQDFAQS